MLKKRSDIIRNLLPFALIAIVVALSCFAVKLQESFNRKSAPNDTTIQKPVIAVKDPDGGGASN
jgi:hypothetical protein